jgi:FKBP-type peptidyl-prolyl cis-trans isomerase FkpA
MYKKLPYFVALLGAVVFLNACKKEYETVEDLDKKSVEVFKNSIPQTFTDDPTGYSYSITNVGSGAAVKYADSVYYYYKFKKLNGTVLNETADLMRPGTFLGYTDQFVISQVSYSLVPIREVLAKLNRGGSALLILPSKLAFGKNGISAFGIGSNETLLVELGLYEQAKRHEVDAYEINKFISNNNLTFSTDASGIKYKVDAAGTGTDIIGEHSTITATYTGRYLDGSVFDSGKEVSFNLSGLIKGWQIILPGKVTAGGKMRMIIPSHLAYGVRPLDFDIEITKVVNN